MTNEQFPHWSSDMELRRKLEGPCRKRFQQYLKRPAGSVKLEKTKITGEERKLCAIAIEELQRKRLFLIAAKRMSHLRLIRISKTRATKSDADILIRRISSQRRPQLHSDTLASRPLPPSKSIQRRDSYSHRDRSRNDRLASHMVRPQAMPWRIHILDQLSAICTRACDGS